MSVEVTANLQHMRQSEMICKYCAEYFPQWQCGANRDTGECDCPKCQGICECTDPIVESVKDLLDERSQAGMSKYGTTLARTDIDLLGWIQHLQEELLDAACYLERIKGEMK